MHDDLPEPYVMELLTIIADSEVRLSDVDALQAIAAAEAREHGLVVLLPDRCGGRLALTARGRAIRERA